jgi:hypothetical protein
MADTGSSSSGLVSLYQVLEAEYVALHGPLPKDYAQTDDNPEKRLAAIFALIHAQKPSALCISGGGIRSATFALGVLQGLARIGLLQKFDYLSTVSGGGYIGGWLSSWAHRDPGGLDSVAKALAAQPQKKLDPEAVALEHLREYSNYLSPKVGLVSGRNGAPHYDLELAGLDPVAGSGVDVAQVLCGHPARARGARFPDSNDRVVNRECGAGRNLYQLHRVEQAKRSEPQ